MLPEMNAQDIEGMVLSNAAVEDIIAEIQDAKRAAKEHGKGDLGVTALHFNGALSVILCRIDQRIGDAVWME